MEVMATTSWSRATSSRWTILLQEAKPEALIELQHQMITKA